MRKKMYILALVCILLPALLSVGWTMDYHNMSNQELYELRGAIRNAPESEQEAYRLEWEQRVAAMTDAEKKEYLQPEEDARPDMLETPRTPAKGYENQPGQVIFGGFPDNGGAAR